MNSYVLKDPEWLWHNRVPKGKLVLLDADPGLGKSLLALEIAAIISRGGKWPDEGGQHFKRKGQRTAPWEGAVIILSAEDDPDDTIGPRLKAAKANFNNIQILEGVMVGERDYEFDDGGVASYPHVILLSLKKHIHQIRQAIKKTPGVKLIIIDTLSAYMGGVDTHRDADVRSILYPLAQLAWKTGVTVLAIRHLNKDQEGRALYRGMGSIGFTGQARAVWMIVRDPDDDEYRLLLPIKSNFVAEKDMTALRFTFDDTFGRSAPYVVWDGEPFKVAQADIEKLVKGKVTGPTQIEQAEDLLEAVLDGGQEMLRSEIEQIAAQRYIKPWALEKAKKNLGVKHRTDGHQGPSLWSMPQSRGQQREDGPEIGPAQTRDRPRVRPSRDWHIDTERRKKAMLRRLDEYDVEDPVSEFGWVPPSFPGPERVRLSHGA